MQRSVVSSDWSLSVAESDHSSTHRSAFDVDWVTPSDGHSASSHTQTHSHYLYDGDNRIRCTLMSTIARIARLNCDVNIRVCVLNNLLCRVFPLAQKNHLRACFEAKRSDIDYGESSMIHARSIRAIRLQRLRTQNAATIKGKQNVCMITQFHWWFIGLHSSTETHMLCERSNVCAANCNCRDIAISCRCRFSNATGGGDDVIECIHK